MDTKNIIAANEDAIAILKRYIEGNLRMDSHEAASLICSFIPKSYQEYEDAPFHD